MKNVYLILAAIIVSMLPRVTKAQNVFPANGSAGIGTTTPDASSVIEMESTTKGMLTPRMTKAQRDAIVSPATGLMIYQTDNGGGFYYFDGGGWKPVSTAGVNKSLSNLSSPTSVNVDLVAAANSYVSLGSYNIPWQNVFVAAGIYLNGSRFISSSGSDNTFVGALSGGQISTGGRNTGTGEYALFWNSTGDDNTASGYRSLSANGSGARNSAFGSDALYANTTGLENSAFGYTALNQNTTGSYNSAFGAYTLSKNTTGYNNTATGQHSLNYNTTGYHNTADGFNALSSNTTGYYNCAVGTYTLFTNSAGHDNAAIGQSAMYSNKFGSYNAAVGSLALYNNTGSYNTATGQSALYANTSATQNTANGYEALYQNTTGSQNTAIGANALMFNSIGSYNAAGGRYALYRNDDGYENTAFGAQAGSNVQSNNYCSFFGYDANQATNITFINSTAIGSTSRITGNNQVRLGNSNVTSIGGYANWSNISDGRFKKNLKENVPGLAFINKLKPVTYNLDITGLRQFLEEDASYDKDGKKLSTQPDEKMRQAIQKKEAMIQTGFVAQDVEKAAKELGYDFSGVDKPENENSPYGLRYSEFVVPLVKAVQELSKQNDDLKQQNEELRSRLDKIEAMLSANSKQSSADISNQQKISLQQTAKLEQNQPNPTAQTAVIKYFIPEQSSRSMMRITSANGHEIKSIDLSAKGNGQITLQTSNLLSGTYFYSLVIDGQIVDTKRMVIAH